MINKHIKRCSTLLIIREMQIKSTMRYHLMLIRMAFIKKSTNNNYWRGCGEEEILLLCWWECKLIQPLWKRVWRFFRKLEIKPPYDPAIPLLGIYPEESEVSEVAQLCPTLCDPMNCRPTRLPRPWDLYWSGLPFPSPRDLPNPGIEPRSPTL